MVDHGRLRPFLWGIAIMFVALLVTAALLEGVLRAFFPQPIDYYTIVQRPEPGKVYQRWGVEVHFNSHGFRDHEYATRKALGVIRIAAIGDSITYGTGVAVDDTYHRRLEFLLNRGLPNQQYEVVAFNQGAASTKWAWNIYESVVTRFEPDIVLLGFCLNDFLDYTHDSASPESLRHRLYDGLANTHEWMRVRSHLYFLIFERSRRLAYKYVLDRKVRTLDSWIAMQPDSEEFQRRFRSTMEELKGFAKSVKAHNQRLIVIVFPYEMQLNQTYAELYRREYMMTGLEHAPDGEVQKLLGAEFQRLGVEYVDLLDVFQRALGVDPQTQLYFRELGGMLDWVHPNEQGHDLAAREIAAFLKMLNPGARMPELSAIRGTQVALP